MNNSTHIPILWLYVKLGPQLRVSIGIQCHVLTNQQNLQHVRPTICCFETLLTIISVCVDKMLEVFSVVVFLLALSMA